MPSSHDILARARALRGIPYADLDCSHFVHRAYEEAQCKYPYQSTKSFAEKTKEYFVEEALPAAGDVVLYSGHMGIYDPQGCQVLKSDQVCRQLNDDAPILSARSGGNMGVAYGRSSWFETGKKPKYFRWKGLTA